MRTVFVKAICNAPTEKSEVRTGEQENKSPQSTHVNPSDSKQENWGKFTTGAGGKKSCTLTNVHAQTTILKKKFKLEFAVDAVFMDMLDEVRALLSKKYPRGVPFEKLFEIIMTEYLEKHSPRRKMQRREKRREKRRAKKSAMNLGKKTSSQDNLLKKVQANDTKTRMPAHNNCSKSTLHKHTRHIPQAVQDKVFARDRGRCAFVGTDGRRCNSTWNLEIDHIKPFARGGDHSIHNLRLLCAKHNNFAAERAYGKKFIESKICKTTSIRK